MSSIIQGIVAIQAVSSAQMAATWITGLSVIVLTIIEVILVLHVIKGKA